MGSEIEIMWSFSSLYFVFVYLQGNVYFLTPSYFILRIQGMNSTKQIYSRDKDPISFFFKKLTKQSHKFTK